MHFTRFFKEIRGQLVENPELVEKVPHFSLDKLKVMNGFTFKPNAMKSDFNFK